MAEQFTVERLAKYLQQAIKKHPEIAKKLVVISDDTEGNGYHGLYFGLTYTESGVKECIECSNGVYDTDTDEPSKIAILG